MLLTLEGTRLQNIFLLQHAHITLLIWQNSYFLPASFSGTLLYLVCLRILETPPRIKTCAMHMKTHVHSFQVILS